MSSSDCQILWRKLLCPLLQDYYRTPALPNQTNGLPLRASGDCLQTAPRKERSKIWMRMQRILRKPRSWTPVLSEEPPCNRRKNNQYITDRSTQTTEHHCWSACYYNSAKTIHKPRTLANTPFHKFTKHFSGLQESRRHATVRKQGKKRKPAQKP